MNIEAVSHLATYNCFQKERQRQAKPTFLEERCMYHCSAQTRDKQTPSLTILITELIDNGRYRIEQNQAVTCLTLHVQPESWLSSGRLGTIER